MKELVELYQCPGCVCGSDYSCYAKGFSHACEKHVAGTTIMGLGKIALGFPKGFNRVGDGVQIDIFLNKGAFEYNALNVPVWKRLDENGNTLVRGLSPRINKTFLHVYQGDVMAKIDCFEVTDDFLAAID